MIFRSAVFSRREGMSEAQFGDRQTLHGWVESKAGRAFVHGQAWLEPLGVYAVEEIRIV